MTLELRFAADFADLFEVRGTPRERAAGAPADARTGTAVVLAYTGLDGSWRTTTLRFEPAPVDAGRQRGRRSMLDAGAGRALRDPCRDRLRCGGSLAEQPPLEAYFIGLRDARRALRRAAGRAASIETATTTSSTRRCGAVSADLAMLVTDTPEGPFPYAGIPWFSAPSGGTR